MNFDLMPLEEGNQQEHVFIPADLKKDKDRVQGWTKIWSQETDIYKISNIKECLAEGLTST